jgi:hypothetical protein
MGVGYSMWSQKTTVMGTVTTGNVLVGIRQSYTNDGGPDCLVSPGMIYPTSSPLNGTLDPRVAPFVTAPSSVTSFTGDKNVASYNETQNGAILFNPGPGFPTNNYNYYASCTDTIANAYPFYAPYFGFEICSGGDIPIIINSVTITNVTDLNNILGSVLIYWDMFIAGTSGTIIGHGTFAQFATALQNAHFQLETFQELYVTGVMVFPQSTPLSSSCSFNLNVTAAQWNEVS